MTNLQINSAFSIHSDEAAIVSGRVECWNCTADIEVIGVYCQSGFVRGEPMLDFSVANITDVDNSLRLQLAQWPLFLPIRRLDAGSSVFGNHCPLCGETQADVDLHCHPQGIFFSFEDTRAEELRIHALQGLVRLSGDEGTEY